MMMEESTHVLLYIVSQEPEHHMIAGLELEVSTILVYDTPSHNN